MGAGGANVCLPRSCCFLTITGKTGCSSLGAPKAVPEKIVKSKIKIDVNFFMGKNFSANLGQKHPGGKYKSVFNIYEPFCKIVMYVSKNQKNRSY